jgi:uncharacterized membrane protein YdjX (TVP38/TMEM64 family)
MTQQRQLRLNSKLKLFFGACMVAALIIAANLFDIPGLLHDALLWVRSLGGWGAIAFITLYILATVLFVPGSLLTLGAGVLFGAISGSVYVFVGASVGATLAFLVGRYLARGWVSQRIAGNAKFTAIDEAIAREGFKIVLLTRLSPIFPFNLLNYSLGITRVSLTDYILGFIGMVPGTIMYVYIGSLAGNLAMIGSEPAANPETQRLQWIIRIVGLIATVAVTVYVTQIARKALDQSVSPGEGGVSHVEISDR